MSAREKRQNGISVIRENRQNCFFVGGNVACIYIALYIRIVLIAVPI
jgi:hypothetical protein